MMPVLDRDHDTCWRLAKTRRTPWPVSRSTWTSAESAAALSGTSSLRVWAGSSMQYVPSALALTASSPLKTVSKRRVGDLLPSPAVVQLVVLNFADSCVSKSCDYIACFCNHTHP